MPDREKVIKGLECCTQHGSMCGSDCDGYYERYINNGYVIKLVNEYRSKCPYGKCETGCVKTLAKDALELLKEQEKETDRILKVVRDVIYSGVSTDTKPDQDYVYKLIRNGVQQLYMERR